MRLCRMNRIEYRVECIKMFFADVEFALSYEIMAERKSQAIVSCLLIFRLFA